MSRNRSRNIKEKVSHRIYHNDRLPPHWFGEYLHDTTSNPKETNLSFYGDADGVDNISISKSSSSSLSWGEDCEIEATHRVKLEYERMNRILAGLEAIPPHYDRDEYKLWIKTFPSLRSTNRIQHSENSKQNTKNVSDNLPDHISRNAVIDDLLNKMCYKLTDSTTETKILDRRKKAREKHLYVKHETTGDKNSLQHDFANLLRISPAPTCDRLARLEKRRKSTNYIDTMNFVNNNNNSREYASLPHLSHPSIKVSSSRCKNSDTLQRKGKKRQYANKIVLPPLDLSLNQFRSISAIPLQQSKCSSAMSTKTNFVIDCNNPNIVCNSRVNSKRLNGFY